MSTYLGRALMILGLGFVMSVAGIIVLAATENPIPDVLQNLAVGSMGMIGALLARGSGGDSGGGTPPAGP